LYILNDGDVVETDDMVFGSLDVVWPNSEFGLSAALVLVLYVFLDRLCSFHLVSIHGKKRSIFWDTWFCVRRNSMIPSERPSVLDLPNVNIE
jgi:hypothetical protein